MATVGAVGSQAGNHHVRSLGAGRLALASDAVRVAGARDDHFGLADRSASSGGNPRGRKGTGHIESFDLVEWEAIDKNRPSGYDAYLRSARRLLIISISGRSQKGGAFHGAAEPHRRVLRAFG